MFSTSFGSTRRSPGSTFKNQLWRSCVCSLRASVMEQITSNTSVIWLSAEFQEPTESSLFWWTIFSERELKFTFAICHRPSVCLSSVTFVHPTQAIEIFGNVSMPCGTLAIHDLCIKILPRSSKGNPFDGGLNPRGVAKYSDFRLFEGYISKTVQDRR